MNKADLIREVAVKTKQTQAAVAATIDALFDAVSDGLNEDGGVTLADFGAFKLVETAARTHRNPRTGGAVHRAAGVAVRFKAFAGLTRAVSGEGV